MPYTAAAKAFFGLCAHNPEKARRPCPKGAKKLMAEARSMPTKKAKRGR